jgi:hypothetical protein
MTVYPPGAERRFRDGLALAVVLAALAYPLLLGLLYRAGRFLHAANGTAATAGAWVLTLVALGLVFAVAVLAFMTAWRLGRGEPAAVHRKARLLAHLAFAAPPIFTLIGVLTYMAGSSSGDYWIWGFGWAAAVIYLWRGGATRSTAGERAPAWLPPVHGAVAGGLVAGFLVLHFVNHLAGLWSAETHLAVMDVLRRWYRHPLVEPALVALMLFMVGSGLVLLRARLSRGGDFFGTLLTATAAFLLFFIPGHMNSVFIFQRAFMDGETDFWFAAGGQAGLLGDPWNVRLIPHYVLGVWGLITHAACGLRQVLIEHGVAVRITDRMTAAISVAGALAATAMVLGLCRVHLA